MRAEPVLPEQLDLGGRQALEAQDAAAYGVVDVVVDVGDPVHQPHDPPLHGLGRLRPGVAEDALAHLLGEVEVLDPLHHPQRVLVVPERPAPALAHARVEHLLADVAERRVAEVVTEPDRLGEVLVQPERPRDVARDAAGLERVGEAGAVVVALGGDEHLGLVLEPPERLGVDDPVAVALERRAVLGVRLGACPAGGIGGRGERRPVRLLEALDALAEGGGGGGGGAAHQRDDCLRPAYRPPNAAAPRVELVELEPLGEVLPAARARRGCRPVRRRAPRRCRPASPLGPAATRP